MPPLADRAPLLTALFVNFQESGIHEALIICTFFVLSPSFPPLSSCTTQQWQLQGTFLPVLPLSLSNQPIPCFPPPFLFQAPQVQLHLLQSGPSTAALSGEWIGTRVTAVKGGRGERVNVNANRQGVTWVWSGGFHTFRVQRRGEKGRKDFSHPPLSIRSNCCSPELGQMLQQPHHRFRSHH